jgi:hypothetical protein
VTDENEQRNARPSKRRGRAPCGAPSARGEGGSVLAETGQPSERADLELDGVQGHHEHPGRVMALDRRAFLVGIATAVVPCFAVAQAPQSLPAHIGWISTEASRTHSSTGSARAGASMATSRARA